MNRAGKGVRDVVHNRSGERATLGAMWRGFGQVKSVNLVTVLSQ